jgi:hypothetical protein
MSQAPELFQLGGYKLSQSEINHWCQAYDINPPTNETVFVINRWLASRGLRTRVLMHKFDEPSEAYSYVVITDKRKVVDWTEPVSPFEESENSVNIKAHLGMIETELQYVTVRKWLKTKRRGPKNRSFKSVKIPNGASEEERGRPRTRAVRTLP